MKQASVTGDWTQFDPSAYLSEYYADVGGENRALLEFLVEAYRDLPPGGIMLDFGGGPTIYPLISAVDAVKEIHFSDFLDANLEEVRRWLDGDPQAFDWREFVRQALELERRPDRSESAVAQREEAIRSKVTQLLRCDASRKPPIEGALERYDAIVTNFCAESATSDRWQWCEFVLNSTALLRPGGTLIISALKGAQSYSVGSKYFPAVDITEADLLDLLEDSGFPRKTIELRVVPADRSTRDYEGLLLAVATKEDDPAQREA